MGPLQGYSIVEMAGIGPAPFCAMLLADMGAEVIRIDRRVPAELGFSTPSKPVVEVSNRGRRSVAVDLKSEAGRDVVLRLVANADGLIEGFRPGVMERLGLDPDACFKVNEKLIYGRMTGFGQDGPLAHRAGHDINYIALSGALASIGREGEPPVPPLNLLGDYGGGGMVLAFGLVCALLEVQRSGKGQMIDAAMAEGAAYLMSPIYGRLSQGLWRPQRGGNFLDGSAPWYDSYETADGKYVAIGSIEGRFYAELLERLGLDSEELPAQRDRKGWPVLRARFSEVFKSKTRDEWGAVFEGSDACFAPVVDMAEAPAHPHNAAREAFLECDGITIPAPVPRFSRTAPEADATIPQPGADTDDVLADWGFDAGEIAALREQGVVGAAG